MSTQSESSLVWQARIRHADRGRIASSLSQLLMQVYNRACGLVPMRTSMGFNPQTMSFRVVPQDGNLWVPQQLNLSAPTELQSDDRIMWRVQAPERQCEDHEWPEIGQVYWDLVNDVVRYIMMPSSDSSFARRPRDDRPAPLFRGVRDDNFPWDQLTDEMMGWVREDDRSGVILGSGAMRLVAHEGRGPEEMGRMRAVLREYEHFPMLPIRTRCQGLRMLGEAVASRTSRHGMERFRDFMRSHLPMSLDRIEGWVIDRLIVLDLHTSDELSEPEARASAIQAAMIRNNMRAFDELTQLGLSCLGRARVRTERQRRYGSGDSRNPCAEITLPMESPPPDETTRLEVLRNGWADSGNLNMTRYTDFTQIQMGEVISETPVAAGTRMTVDRVTGRVRPALQDEPVMGIATGRATTDGLIELSTGRGNIQTPLEQAVERVRGQRADVMIIDEAAETTEMNMEAIRQIMGVDYGTGSVTTGITRVNVEEARNLPREIERSRRRRRQDELRAELIRVASQMFDPSIDDGSMSAADMALAHLRFRLNVMLTAVPVGRLKADVQWNNDQSLDVLIKDPQNGDAELSRIRMDEPGEFVRSRLPEVEIGVGERAIDL